MTDRESQAGRDAHDGPFSTLDRNELDDPRSLGSVSTLVFDNLPRQLDSAEDEAELDAGTDTNDLRVMEQRVHE
jgi:hypothetical protein